MTDLTTHAVPVCSSNVDWSAVVPGSKEDHVVSWGFRPHGYTQYDWHCTCQAFKFGRGKLCKHIESVKATRCAWNAELEMHRCDDGKCPKCGEAVKYIQVAV